MSARVAMAVPAAVRRWRFHCTVFANSLHCRALADRDAAQDQQPGCNHRRSHRLVQEQPREGVAEQRHQIGNYRGAGGTNALNQAVIHQEGQTGAEHAQRDNAGPGGCRNGSGGPMRQRERRQQQR